MSVCACMCNVCMYVQCLHVLVGCVVFVWYGVCVSLCVHTRTCVVNSFCCSCTGQGCHHTDTGHADEVA